MAEGTSFTNSSALNLGCQAGTFNNSGVVNFNSNIQQPSRSDPPSPLYVFPTRTPGFSGRNETFKNICAEFSKVEDVYDSLERLVILQGFGGMGKSEIGKAFGEKVQKESLYDYFVWIDAQTENSLMSSFRDVARKLGLNNDTDLNLDEIYETLARRWRKGIILFDNAEQLVGKGGKFGIQNCMYNKFLLNKPFFLVTTRNGGDSWEAETTSIKKIQIDCLTEQESFEYLLQRFVKNEQRIPETLETSIRELGRTLEGYPLGLALVASKIKKTVGKEATEDLESQIKWYIKILTPEGIEKLSGYDKYREQLNVNFKDTLLKIEREKHGSKSLEILGVLSYCSPDRIYAGFLNGVLMGTNFSLYEDTVEFRIGDMDKFVKRGFKLLSSYSLVNHSPEDFKFLHCKYVNDVIRIHRLIQDQARDCLKQLQNDSIAKLVYFFEKSEQPDSWIRHLLQIMKHISTLETSSARFRYLVLCWWKLLLTAGNTNERLAAAQTILHYALAHPNSVSGDDQILFELGKMYSRYHRFYPNEEIDCFQVVKDFPLVLEKLTQLGNEAISQAWILGACTETVATMRHYMQHGCGYKNASHSQLDKSQSIRMDLLSCEPYCESASWFFHGWMGIGNVKTNHHDVTRLFMDGSTSILKPGSWPAILRKWFQCLKETHYHQFWSDVLQNNLLGCIPETGWTDILWIATESLTVTDLAMKNIVCQRSGQYFGAMQHLFFKMKQAPLFRDATEYMMALTNFTCYTFELYKDYRSDCSGLDLYSWDELIARMVFGWLALYSDEAVPDMDLRFKETLLKPVNEWLVHISQCSININGIEIVLKPTTRGQEWEVLLKFIELNKCNKELTEFAVKFKAILTPLSPYMTISW